MTAIDEYIAELWKPETFSARQYADMGLDEIEDIVRAKEEDRRGRKQYSIGEIVEHIWISSISPGTTEGLSLYDFDHLEDLIPPLPDLKDLGITEPGDGLDECLHSRKRRH